MDIITPQDIVEVTSGDLAIAVASTANVYSKSLKINWASAMALWFRATVTSGTADVDLYLEQGFTKPVTEGGAGVDADGFIVIGTKIGDITANDTWQAVTLSPVTMPYMRILCDGQGSNPATCKVYLKLGLREALT